MNPDGYTWIRNLSKDGHADQRQVEKYHPKDREFIEEWEWENVEPLYSVYTFLAWLKDNRRRATKDYGQAAEQGTNIEKTFEAGFSSAMDHLVDEFKEEFEIYDGPQNVEELEEGRETLSEDKAKNEENDE